MTEPQSIEMRYRQLQAQLAAARPDLSLLSGPAMSLASDAFRNGHSEIAASLLEQLVALAPQDARAWQLLGFARGELQCIPEAATAFAQAARYDPDNLVTILALARASLDAGYEAATLYESALQLSPGNHEAISGLAASLSAAGEKSAAQSVLVEGLRQAPGWLSGHRMLAALRYGSGELDHFTDSYAVACAEQPNSVALRLAWFSAIAQTQQWPDALRIISEGEQILGKLPVFAGARAFVASESGQSELAEGLFAEAAASRDDVLGIALLRHCIRTGQLARAETLALELLPGRTRRNVWPYLSVIWRLRGDSKAAWLDGAPPYIRVFDLEYSPGELAELASTLRRIPIGRSAYLDQSVRHGVQTDVDRQLFYRAEPAIRAVRAKVETAVRQYIAEMPAPSAGHPLLDVPRDRVRFSGSWNVQLTSQGHHVSHTHPLGCISSAFYVSLPEARQLGPAPAGWISFGRPPRSLGTQLPAYTQLEPRAGRLILFPSTLWHETVPFNNGERLVIAFDVMSQAARV